MNSSTDSKKPNTITILIAIVIVLALILVYVTSKCPCGCSCRGLGCSILRNCCSCECGNDHHDVNMDVTGPYQLPEDPPVGMAINLKVDAQPIAVRDRNSEIGFHFMRTLPDVHISTEPIYSQNGEWYTNETEDMSFVNGLAVESFTERLNNTRRIYYHYTNWCGFCKQTRPIWEQIKATLVDTAIEFYEVDEDVAKTPGINGYPTIIMLDENGFRHQYPGTPNFEELRSWVISPRLPQTVQ